MNSLGFDDFLIGCLEICTYLVTQYLNYKLKTYHLNTKHLT